MKCGSKMNMYTQSNRQKMITMGSQSMVGIMLNQQGHIHSEGKTRPKDIQHVGFHPTDKITYILRVKQGQRHLTCRFLSSWQDHIPTESGTRPQDIQHAGFYPIDKITYKLRAEPFNMQIFTQLTRSHTRWGQNKATRHSTCRFSPNWQGHIQTGLKERTSDV